MVTNGFHVANEKTLHALMGDSFSMFWVMGGGEGVFFSVPNVFSLCSH
jgi:hypothetical protein